MVVGHMEVGHRSLHRERLNQLLFEWWPKAMDNPSAFDRVLRLLEREANLLGLDCTAEGRPQHGRSLFPRQVFLSHGGQQRTAGRSSPVTSRPRSTRT